MPAPLLKKNETDGMQHRRKSAISTIYRLLSTNSTRQTERTTRFPHLLRACCSSWRLQFRCQTYSTMWLAALISPISGDARAAALLPPAVHSICLSSSGRSVTTSPIWAVSEGWA